MIAALKPNSRRSRRSTGAQAVRRGRGTGVPSIDAAEAVEQRLDVVGCGPVDLGKRGDCCG
jgi:hypothetical protein